MNLYLFIALVIATTVFATVAHKGNWRQALSMNLKLQAVILIVAIGTWV